MAALTVSNAFNLPRVVPTKSPKTASPSVPLHQPFASQRNLQRLAYNPAMDSAAFQASSPLSFVRPDVPPVAEDRAQGVHTRNVAATAEAQFKARPQFRSALEQVSYVTNNKLFDARKQANGRKLQRSVLGFFGL